MSVPTRFGIMTAVPVLLHGVLRSEIQFKVPDVVGTLRTVSVGSGNSLIRAAEAYAVISLQSNTVNLEDLTATLASGYFGTEHPLGWEGNVPMTEEEFIFIRVWQSIAFTPIIKARIVTEA